MTDSPDWEALLLPDSFTAAPEKAFAAPPLAPAHLDAMYPVDDLGVVHPARRVWLSSVHNGRIVLGGGFAAMGSPERVALVLDEVLPGLALIDASLVPEDGPRYPILPVGPSGSSGRVSLPRAAHFALRMPPEGAQVVMVMSGHCLLVARPEWNASFPLWDEVLQGGEA